MIYQHLEATESARAKEVLADWARFQEKFWKVTPLPPVAAKPAAAKPAAAVVPPAAAEIMTAANP